MESCANDTTLDHDLPSPYTTAETEAISELTAEVFCNNTLRPFCLAAVRDEDIGADKLYEQLRHDLKSLGLFIRVEDRALCKFAEAMKDESISNGIARAVVLYAQEVIRWKGAADEEPDAGNMASTGKPGPVEDASATIINGTPRTHYARPTFHLSLPTAHAILDLGAYIALTPPLITLILHSKRYLSLRSHLLDLVFCAYAQRLAIAIGSSALGEDGQVLHWSRLQTVIDELARTPPHKISYAAHGTKAAQVVWISPSGEHEFEAPELREGWCRVKWTSREGFVRFVDVRVGDVRRVKEGVWSAPKVKGFVS
jgi:hypothetical protein